MTIHLTELRLNHAGRSLLSDTQKVHRSVMWAVGGDARTQWASPRRDILIIQSSRPVRASDFDGVVIESHSVEKPLDIDGAVELSLIGFPTRSAPTNGRGKIQLLPMDRWEPWLRRKLSPAVSLDRVAVQDLGPRTGVRHGGRVVHRWVGFSATGVVTDPSLLRTMLTDGVGRGKAYGCGLLLAVPA